MDINSTNIIWIDRGIKLTIVYIICSHYNYLKYKNIIISNKNFRFFTKIMFPKLSILKNDKNTTNNFYFNIRNIIKKQNIIIDYIKNYDNKVFTKKISIVPWYDTNDPLIIYYYDKKHTLNINKYKLYVNKFSSHRRENYNNISWDQYIENIILNIYYKKFNNNIKFNNYILNDYTIVHNTDNIIKYYNNQILIINNDYKILLDNMKNYYNDQIITINNDFKIEIEKMKNHNNDQIIMIDDKCKIEIEKMEKKYNDEKDIIVKNCEIKIEKIKNHNNDEKNMINDKCKIEIEKMKNHNNDQIITINDKCKIEIEKMKNHNNDQIITINDKWKIEIKKMEKKYNDEKDIIVEKCKIGIENIEKYNNQKNMTNESCEIEKIKIEQNIYHDIKKNKDINYDILDIFTESIELLCVL